MLKRTRAASQQEEVGLGLVEDVQEDIEESKPATSINAAAVFPLWKFFELYMPSADKYQKAYLDGLYRGQMKTPDEWFEEIKNHIK